MGGNTSRGRRRTESSGLRAGQDRVCQSDSLANRSVGHESSIRKNDRDFKEYDMVHLLESVNGIKTGRVLPSFEIRFILHGPAFGIPEGYCIFNW